MSEKLTEWIIKQFELRGASTVLLIIVLSAAALVAMGTILGWFLALSVKRTELDRLRIELRQAGADIVNSLATAREKWTSQKELVTLALSNLRDCLHEHGFQRKTADDLRVSRDELCNIYSTKYLDVFGNYLELIEVLETRQQARTRAETELLGALEFMLTVLTVANAPKLLEKIPSSAPYRLRRISRNVIFHRVSNLVPLRCLRLKFSIWKIKRKTECHVR